MKLAEFSMPYLPFKTLLSFITGEHLSGNLKDFLYQINQINIKVNRYVHEIRIWCQYTAVRGRYQIQAVNSDDDRARMQKAIGNQIVWSEDTSLQLNGQNTYHVT